MGDGDAEVDGKRFEGVAGEADELPDLLLSSLKSSLDELRESFSICKECEQRSNKKKIGP